MSEIHHTGAHRVERPDEDPRLAPCCNLLGMDYGRRADAPEISPELTTTEAVGILVLTIDERDNNPSVPIATLDQKHGRVRRDISPAPTALVGLEPVSYTHLTLPT